MTIACDHTKNKDIFLLENMQKVEKDEEKLKLRKRRLDREEKTLKDKVLEKDLILNVDRAEDTFTIEMRRVRTNNRIFLYLKFPEDYPMEPPYWRVYADAIRLPELDWLTQDPFKGGYGPHYSLYMLCERIVKMTHETKYGLKDYKKKKS